MGNVLFSMGILDFLAISFDAEFLKRIYSSGITTTKENCSLNSVKPSYFTTVRSWIPSWETAKNTIKPAQCV